jgi:hypothetical protein
LQNGFHADMNCFLIAADPAPVAMRAPTSRFLYSWQTITAMTFLGRSGGAYHAASSMT